MSTVVAKSPASSLAQSARPSFLGLIQGELIKLSRQWLTWLMVLCLVAGTILLHFIIASNSGTQTNIATSSPQFFYSEMNMTLFVLRVFGGIFLMILTGLMIGMEYQNGTIRIILARGVGRVQLLLAKLTAMLIVGIELFVVGVLFNALLMLITLYSQGGNISIINKMPAEVWNNIGIYLYTVAISFAVTILMAATVSVLGRSLAFGMSVALAWFAVDNIGSLFLYLAHGFTKQQFFLDVTAYLLGPILNVMPKALLPKSLDITVTFSPFVKVDGPHTLWVALAYGVAFLAISIGVIWKRDVHE
ncbi:hypothetical protein KSD_23130 [Ktedonobacter sp. SOSP1-85]|uniref:ABC transporter permease n=1 Tax=Ktedonobacter sp. SOSP1-85 TaxID=2778367 RepID=UPI0019159D76|nr:ABC transporter permease [Ktedonobacter sp. SOSP1-85]GHO74542.1 hypothetical protein KSD_23130 [Ktedonobacter sp. SOSP1-85]